MCVALGHGDGAVTEEDLYEPNVESLIDKQRRRGMAEHVRCYVTIYPSCASQAGKHSSNCLSRDPSPLPGQEERACWGAVGSVSQVLLKCTLRVPTDDVSHSLLASLAVDSKGQGVGLNVIEA